MKNNYGFNSINSILDKIVKKLGIDRGLKEITLINLWPEIIGPKFKDNSKLVSVIRKNNQDALLIAVSSSAISQELFLFKGDILKKLSPIAMSLEFNVKDIILSTKLWQDTSEKSDFSPKNDVSHHFIKNPTDKELQDIHVPENIINSIKESIKTQNFSSLELKDRILSTIIRDIKVQIWRKNNGFPCCSKCGISVNYFTQNETILCPACKYNS